MNQGGAIAQTIRKKSVRRASNFLTLLSSFLILPIPVRKTIAPGAIFPV